jgi:predicted N-acetyltransferase YhbS
VDVATDLMTMLLSHPRFFSVVAELDGAVVGSNFLDERSPVAGLGPITVDPKVQNLRIGRRLMLAALDRVTERGLLGVRLLQSAYHGRSLALSLEKQSHACKAALSACRWRAIGCGGR